MGLRDLTILRKYVTYKNNVVKEFYTPILKQAVEYKRAVGFFSSTALIDLTKGIAGIAKNGGTIKFIVSPKLSEEDIEAINKGYEQKAIIEQALLREFKEPENYFEEERLNILANLIADGILEIKVAFTPPNKEFGMYHEKVGIVKDCNGDFITFTGSLNESINAFHNNYESIVVFKSWEESHAYAEEMEADFDLLWAEQDKDLEIIPFPKVIKERFEVRRKEKVNFNIDVEETVADDNSQHMMPKGLPIIPKEFELRDYQEDAINNWIEHNYCGIFDMATGTGKTYTGLGAVAKLFAETKKLAIIIVCPFQHLVEQWVEDIVLFNMKPIIGYSASKQKKWKQRLADDILDYELGVIDSFCFVTTNATFSSEYVQNQLADLKTNAVLVIDEAHNFGTARLLNCLKENFCYRLALSATLERHGDEAGTAALKHYFGEKCIEYDLRRAIKEHKLTPYMYYPVVVYLTEEEQETYNDLSYRVSKECHVDKKGNFKITETGKRILLMRAKVVAGARNKLPALKKLLKNYVDDDHMLVYCGATDSSNIGEDGSIDDDEGERQIDLVSKMMGNELNMKVVHFTSKESAQTRELIKEKFADANPYQAIIAIKCLDEGVNIPSIKTAFILASTTNPKEYIQRRGRVLRLYPGKKYATIYDFVTLAQPLNEINEYSPNFNYSRALARRELARIKEFGSIAQNQRDADELINDIEVAYNIHEITEEDEYYGNEFKQD